MPVMGACYIGVLFHAFYYYWAEEILFTGGQFFFEAKSNRKPESAGPVTATDRQKTQPHLSGSRIVLSGSRLDV